MASAVGDAAVTVALAGSIFFTTSISGARGRVALSLVLTLAPFAVIAPFLGPAIDRSRGGRRWMVIGAAAGRAVACVYMATVVDQLLLFLPTTLVVLVLSKAYAVAKSSLIPNTVASREDLVRAGSRLAVMAAVTGLAAGLVAAGALHAFGAPALLRLAAVAYGAGAVAGLRLRAVPQPPLGAERRGPEARVRGLARAATAMTVLRATVGFMTFAVAFDLRAAHASSWWYAAIAGAGVVGGFVGNALSPVVRRALTEERMLVGALALTCAAGVAAWSLNSRWGLVLFALALGVSAGVARLSFDAIVQRDAEDRVRSRSFARFEALFQLGWVAAALVATLVAGRGIPMRATPLVIGIATGAAAAYFVSGRDLGPRERRPRRGEAAPAPRAGTGSEEPPPPAVGPRRNPLRRPPGLPRHASPVP
jgi:MFS family permease